MNDTRYYIIPPKEHLSRTQYQQHELLLPTVPEDLSILGELAEALHNADTEAHIVRRHEKLILRTRYSCTTKVLSVFNKADIRCIWMRPFFPE
jgi:hypothetical protein